MVGSTKQVQPLIIMMTENNSKSMLVHFPKLCKTLDWNYLNFSLYWRITLFSLHSLDGLLKEVEARTSQKISCYLESENMDALISMCCSALQHWYFTLAELFPARIRVSRPHGFPARIRVSRPPKQAWQKFIECPVAVACQWSRMLTWFQFFPSLFFSLAPYFTLYESDPVPAVRI